MRAYEELLEERFGPPPVHELSAMPLPLHGDGRPDTAGKVWARQQVLLDLDDELAEVA